MLKGYTYSRNLAAPYNYYCSKNDVGCKAEVKLGMDGKIVGGKFDHSHDPPKYIVLKSGQ